MAETFQNILTSPFVITFIWPIVFILFQVLYIVLLRDIIIANDEEKFRVSYKISTTGRPHSGPATLDDIQNLIKEEKEITEIEQLPKHILNMFSFGPDLCI